MLNVLKWELGLCVFIALQSWISCRCSPSLTQSIVAFFGRDSSFPLLYFATTRVGNTPRGLRPLNAAPGFRADPMRVAGTA